MSGRGVNPLMPDIVYKPLQSSTGQDIQSAKPSVALDKLCLLYGRRIVESGTQGGSAATVVIYTVPVGKIFLLCTAMINMTTRHGTGNNSTRLCIGQVTGFPSLITLNSYNESSASGEPQTQSMASVNPVIPLRLVAGETITMFSASDAYSGFAISGYELDAVTFYNSL